MASTDSRRGRPATGSRDCVDRIADDLQVQLGVAGVHLDLTKRVSRLCGMLDEAMSACLEPWGLTRADYGVLMALRSVGEPYEMRPTDVRQRLPLSSGGLSNVIRRLVTGGLVVREPDASDGRGSWLRLTPIGADLADDVIYAWAQVQADFFRGSSAATHLRASDALREILLGLGDEEPNDRQRPRVR